MNYNKLKKELEKLKKSVGNKENSIVNLLPIIKAKRNGKDVHSDIPVPEWLEKKILRKRKELEEEQEDKNVN